MGDFDVDDSATVPSVDLEATIGALDVVAVYVGSG